MLNNDSDAIQHQRLPEDDPDDAPQKKQPKLVKKATAKIHTIYTGCMYQKPKPVRFIDSEISSNLSFQKLIYFNMWYSVLHFYIYLICAVYRFWIFTTSDGLFTWNLLRIIFVFAPWGVIEIFRIQNGYIGNIKESFPEIVSFLLQTIFQIILNLFLAVIFKSRLPIEQPVLIIQVIFNIIELYFCVNYIFKLQKAQSALFFWKSPYNKEKSQKKDQIIREYKEAQAQNKHYHGLQDDSDLDQSRYMDNPNNNNSRDDYNRERDFYKTGGDEFGNTVTSFRQTGGLNRPYGSNYGGNNFGSGGGNYGRSYGNSGFNQGGYKRDY